MMRRTKYRISMYGWTGIAACWMGLGIKTHQIEAVLVSLLCVVAAWVHWYLSEQED